MNSIQCHTNTQLLDTALKHLLPILLSNFKIKIDAYMLFIRSFLR